MERQPFLGEERCTDQHSCQIFLHAFQVWNLTTASEMFFLLLILISFSHLLSTQYVLDTAQGAGNSSSN